MANPNQRPDENGPESHDTGAAHPNNRPGQPAQPGPTRKPGLEQGSPQVQPRHPMPSRTQGNPDRR